MQCCVRAYLLMAAFLFETSEFVGCLICFNYTRTQFPKALRHGRTQEYFVQIAEEEGYGKEQNNPLILLLDAHTSRWSYKGLTTLIDSGIYPYFIGSHTSAWHQPNDNGFNGMWKAEYGKAVQRWRGAHPLMPYDRIAFNWCCAGALLQVFTCLLFIFACLFCDFAMFA